MANKRTPIAVVLVNAVKVAPLIVSKVSDLWFDNAWHLEEVDEWLTPELQSEIGGSGAYAIFLQVVSALRWQVFMIKTRKMDTLWGLEMLRDLRIESPFSVVTKIKWIKWEPPPVCMLKLNVEVKTGCFSDFSATGILPLAGKMLLQQDQAQKPNASRLLLQQDQGMMLIARLKRMLVCEQRHGVG
ncbi:unnamed protein product [Ilex paraguariensis]|uniref:Uncharacterized protein n=1 Tax=Ilex paraguariensis TaxID=185542 RepID=A0ABC8R8W6_9AQUA